MQDKSKMNAKFIEIGQDLPGYDGFFGCWVCQDDVNILTDVGPANTAGRLIESLKAMRLDRVDFVFLTHLHIDHMGALSYVLDQYPTARVICHEKAFKHLIDPSYLWLSSLKALGKTADLYGKPKALPREKLIPHTKSGLKELAIIETPGHSPYHLSFSYKDRLYVGDAVGNYFLIDDREYLRPGTPPKFLLDASLQSIDRLLALKNQSICYAHFGEAESSHRLLEVYHDQVILWKEIIYEQTLKGDENIIKRCIDELFRKDSNLAAFSEMSPDTQKREMNLMAGSVRGFIGFLKGNR